MQNNLFYFFELFKTRSLPFRLRISVYWKLIIHHVVAIVIKFITFIDNKRIFI